jgi:hypothetical protein
VSTTAFRKRLNIAWRAIPARPFPVIISEVIVSPFDARLKSVCETWIGLLKSPSHADC